MKLLKDKKSKIAQINKQLQRVQHSKDLYISEHFENQKLVLGDEFDAQIEYTKVNLLEAYLKECKKAIADYPVFMAIAENIGYDATGKETGKNDLPEIAKELFGFIQAIEEGTDRFFR